MFLLKPWLLFGGNESGAFRYGAPPRKACLGLSYSVIFAGDGESCPVCGWWAGDRHGTGF